MTRIIQDKLKYMEDSVDFFDWVFVFKEYIKQQEHEMVVIVSAATKDEAIAKIVKLAIPQIDGMTEDEIYSHCDQIEEVNGIDFEDEP